MPEATLTPRPPRQPDLDTRRMDHPAIGATDR